MPWVHASLRGSKVFARVDATGAFLSENGRVEIRYKPNDGRKYAARADNLNVVTGQILPEDTCGPATSVADAKSAKAAAATSATPTDGAPSSPSATSSAGAPLTATAAKPARAKRVTKPKTSETEAHDEPAHPTTDAGAIIVYADGACSGNPGPAGLGVVILDPEGRIELSEYIGQGTNNIAELTAILRALDETKDQGRPLLIHTDSSYSIGVLQKGWKAKANQELIAELRDVLRQRRGVRLIYVPGHAGVRWNERADSLARAAVASRKSARHVVRPTAAARA